MAALRLSVVDDFYPDPWAVRDAPESYIATMLRGIVGFEFAIESLEGKYKLSQNRDAADRAAVREAFLREGRADIAGLMDRE